MGYVDCGEKSNLIVSYNKGDDDELAFGWMIRLAQTFTLHASYCICRACILLKPPWGISSADYYLYNTDGTGRPTGAPLATSKQHYETHYPPIPFEWHIINFTSFPFLTPGTYALVASFPTPADFLHVEWRRDETPPVYAEGKAWRSLDFGTTWLTEEDCTLMFEIWGWKPPPEPPPPPVPDNWAVTAFSKLLLDTGFMIYLDTSELSHLWMRWTNIEPRKHLDPVFRRGLAMHTDPRFCFVAWRDNDQEEPGDTTEHSWRKEGWTDGETRWFYFIGSRCGQTSPSVSPIFRLNFGHIVKYSEGPDYWYLRANKDFIPWAILKPSIKGIPEHVRLRLGRKGEPGELTLSLHHCSDLGIPDPDPVEQQTQVITGMPEWPYMKYFTFQFKKPYLLTDAWYAIRATCQSTPPVEVRWPGWTSDLTPNAWCKLYRVADGYWWDLPNNELYYLIRGTKLP